MKSSNENIELMTPGEKIIAEYQEPTRHEKAIKNFDFSTQLGRVTVVLGICVVWWLIYDKALINQSFIASPGQTWKWFVDNWHNKDVWRDIKVTLREAFLGWFIGSSLGLGVGLLTARYKKLWKITSPVFVFFNAVPRTALAPIFILWFGIAETSKVVIVITIVFFIVMIPTRAAAEMVDPDLDMVITTMGGRERDRFYRVVLPSVLTSVFGAIRLASVWALLGASYAELFGAKFGLGLRYMSATNALNMPESFAVTAIIALLALMINAAVGLVEKRLMRWKSNGAQGSVLFV
ncbi:MAG: ABC transporter permease [Ilumatobacteraceae bacterium]|nr:ABC transporter permease [Ilumatobacteraceae bacterium]